MVVFVAGHYIKGDKCLCLLHYLHQVFYQPLKNIYLFGNANIVHSLGVIGAKPSPHAACQQHSPYLPLPDGIKPQGPEPPFLMADLGKLHGRQRGNNPPGIPALSMF